MSAAKAGMDAASAHNPVDARRSFFIFEVRPFFSSRVPKACRPLTKVLGCSSAANGSTVFRHASPVHETNSSVSFGHLCDSQFLLKFNTYLHILTYNLCIHGRIVATAVDQPQMLSRRSSCVMLSLFRSLRARSQSAQLHQQTLLVSAILSASRAMTIRRSAIAPSTVTRRVRRARRDDFSPASQIPTSPA